MLVCGRKVTIFSYDLQQIPFSLPAPQVSQLRLKFIFCGDLLLDIKLVFVKYWSKVQGITPVCWFSEYTQREKKCMNVLK